MCSYFIHIGDGKDEDYGRERQMAYFNNCALPAFHQEPGKTPPTMQYFLNIVDILKNMKKEDAVELADKCLKELAASLEQGQTEVLEKYLSALARFHDYSFRNMMMIVNQFPEASKGAGVPPPGR